MGKTAFMLSNAMAAASAGNAIGIISGEQPVQQLAMRLLSQRSRIEATRLRSGRVDDDEWPRVTGGLTEMQELPIWVYDRSAPSLSELCRIARKWKHQHGIKAIYVDYLQRLQADKDRENKSERVGDITKGLKSLARDLDISVIALAQVKREVEGRTNKRPRMADLSDSGDIEKEADEVLLLYRDEVYNADTPDKGIAEVLIDKNRHGPATFIKCAFHGPTMTFSNLVSPRESWN
jgi:replicative DNA helicase